MVALVGAVEDVTRSVASMEFTLNDGSGRVRARYFASESEQARLSSLVAGSYVSVVGTVRTGPLAISVTCAQLLDCSDWVSHHLIEVAHTALRMRKTGSFADLATARRLDDPLTPQKPVASVSAQHTPVASVQLEETARVKVSSGPILDSASLLSLIQKEGGEEKPQGINIQFLVEHFGQSQESDVRSLVSKLVEDGDVFNTIDSDHFNIL